MEQTSARIPLTQGQYALVDIEDFGWLAVHKWQALWSHNTRSYYAFRTERTSDGKYRGVYMHRAIRNFPVVQVDHRDHDTLNNRRGNLRDSTPTQNQCNRRGRRDNPVGLKGVTKRGSRFVAQIGFKGKVRYIGAFRTAPEAKAAYDAVAIEVHGEFANL